MDYYALTDEGILKELGERLQRLRLSKNISQEDVANVAGLNRTTIVSLESGSNPKLITLVQALRALQALDGLDSFLPEPGVSPLKLAELQGKERQRASASRTVSLKNDKDSEW